MLIYCPRTPHQSKLQARDIEHFPRQTKPPQCHRVQGKQKQVLDTFLVIWYNFQENEARNSFLLIFKKSDSTTIKFLVVWIYFLENRLLGVLHYSGSEGVRIFLIVLIFYSAFFLVVLFSLAFLRFPFLHFFPLPLANLSFVLLHLPFLSALFSFALFPLLLCLSFFICLFFLF